MGIMHKIDRSARNLRDWLELGDLIDSGNTIDREPKTLYVAEFVSRTISDRAVLASFTELFETSLIRTGRYKVLDRRNLNRVLAEAQSEQFVVSMNNLTERVRTKVVAVEGAQGVIFGEVVDDPESGEIVITVSLEGFDAVKHWKRSTTTRYGRARDIALSAQSAPAGNNEQSRSCQNPKGAVARHLNRPKGRPIRQITSTHMSGVPPNSVLSHLFIQRAGVNF